MTETTRNTTIREIGDRGQCEAFDLIPTVNGDDATAIRCHRAGRVIRESDIHYSRIRCVCPLHGLASAMEVQ